MTGHLSEGRPPISVADSGRRAVRATADPEGTLVGYLSRAGKLTPDDTAFTFVDFTGDPSGRREAVTWAQLDQRVGALAQLLMLVGATGQRVAVVAPQGLEYVIAFLGALRAGAIAVPLFPPHMPGHDERLASALGDSEPVCLLTTTGAKAGVVNFCAGRRLPGADRILVVDSPRFEEFPPDHVQGSDPVRLRPEDCAYLQYTSGSTRTPSGVEITHANVIANVRQAMEAFDVQRDRNHVVSWLPLFHDMGLVLAVAIPVVGGVHSVIADPLAFVQQPARWLQLLSEHPGAITAAPNFAYDYCVRRVPDPLRAGLALGDVSVMINGSEPVRPGTLRRFQEAFGSCGLKPHTLRPSYGLAEATVFVSTSLAGQEPHVTAFDRRLLGLGTASPATATADAGATELVACGQPVGQEIAVVDVETGRSLTEGVVGEIWVRGPNVARGYWGSPARSAETFRAELTDGPRGSEGTGRWLRTGDLGAMHDGRLYVTGRIKDLVIIDGTNHYPQDIEVTVQEAHALIRQGHVAAFSLTVDGGERLVVVAEHSRHVTDPGPERDAVARAVRKAVVTGHGAALHDFVLAPPGTLPRTSSGKVARGACRRRYIAGTWTSRIESDMAGAGGEE